MISKFILAVSMALAAAPTAYAAEYVLDGEFEGCDYGRYYGIQGGGLLECHEYKYFYEYMPTVVADGFNVVSIGGQDVDAVLSRGTMITTNVVEEFEGCDFDRQYALDNGLIFVCQTYSYSYAYRPQVQIAIPENGTPVVIIKGKVYRGQIFRK